MLPKEKAKELVKKFEDENLHFEETILESAKYYALVLIEEILNAPKIGEGWLDKYEPYWLDVKKEISLLQLTTYMKHSIN